MQNEFSQRNGSSLRKSPVLECDICPHFCTIPSQDYGKCGIIQNVDGKLTNPRAGYCSNIAVEPIEKRPFYHFSPGSRYLSVGFYGCNFTCDFCQNFRVSQNISGPSKYYSPKDLIQLAYEYKVSGIVFTYNEPILYHEYITEVGHIIKNDISATNRMRLAIKSNGFASQHIIRNLCLYSDAINIDIKGDDDDYKVVCDGSLSPVLKSIELISNMKVHLEISYLVLPNKIDDKKFNANLRDFLSGIDPNIPIHLLYFYPFHNMTVPSYKPSRLLELVDFFGKKMNYVYISNHFGDDLVLKRNTTCSVCGRIMIERKKETIIHHLECCGVSIMYN